VDSARRRADPADPIAATGPALPTGGRIYGDRQSLRVGEGVLVIAVLNAIDVVVNNDYALDRSRLSEARAILARKSRNLSKGVVGR
jgi:hypothetical protein